MSDFLKTNNNNFILDNGDLCLIDKSKEVFQRVRDRLRSFAFEWFLDNEGVPHFSEVLVKEGRGSDIEALILEAVLSVQGVREVNSLDVILDTETRRLTVDINISTIFNDDISLNELVETAEGTDDEGIKDLLNRNIGDLQGNVIADLR